MQYQFASPDRHHVRRFDKVRCNRETEGPATVTNPGIVEVFSILGRRDRRYRLAINRNLDSVDWSIVINPAGYPIRAALIDMAAQDHRRAPRLINTRRARLMAMTVSGSAIHTKSLGSSLVSLKTRLTARGFFRWIPLLRSYLLVLGRDQVISTS